MPSRPPPSTLESMDGLYVGSFGYALGARKRHLRETAAAGLLASAPQDLQAAGFAWHHVCEDGQSAYDLARAAVDEVAAGGGPGGGAGGVDAIVYATCLPPEQPPGPIRDVKELMNFPACRLQAEFGLSGAAVFGLYQQACTGMLGALRVAGALLSAEPGWRRVLCVTADRFPPGARYEQAYNLISDGAAACMVSREAGPLRLLTVHQITNGGMAAAGDDQTVGTYFAFTHRLLRQTVARIGMTVGELDWIVTQNTHEKAWRILARLLDVEHDRVWYPSLPDAGHVISADVIVNLSALLASGRAAPGQRIALVMAGYGLNWQAAVLEVARP